MAPFPSGALYYVQIYEFFWPFSIKSLFLLIKKSKNLYKTSYHMKNANEVFDRCVADYHKTDNVDAGKHSPTRDIIRDPEIDPVAALELKRRIDRSNQVRTDMVEEIDTWYREKYKDVKARPDATINTESPAWALDRLSILALKIWHMREQPGRRTRCSKTSRRDESI